MTPRPAALRCLPAALPAGDHYRRRLRAPASTMGSVALTDLGSGRSWEGVNGEKAS